MGKKSIKSTDTKTEQPKVEQIKEESTEEPKGKSQKIKVLVSIFRYGDKIVSHLGIPRSNSNVEHRIPKKNLRDDELFNIVSAMTNDRFLKNDKRYEQSVKSALDKNMSEIWLPVQPANEFSKKSIGKLVHEIINVEMEIFIK